jgi:uncharacterized protein (DUF2147 family)
MVRTFIYLLLAALLCLPFGEGSLWAKSYDSNRQPLLGIWYTEGHEGAIELYSCDQEICGRFYWIKDESPENIFRDEHNPDPEKRDRPLCQMQFMGGFHLDSDGHYTDGWVYSPKHGQVFNAEITLLDKDTLDVHGYILSPILGESQVWKRAKALHGCRT